MKIFSSENIKKIIEESIAEQGIEMIDFIDRVGEAVTTEVTAMASATQRIVIFAGYDNCGAYALTAATFLNHLGYKPVIYLFNIGGNRLNRECEMALRRFREMCPEGNIVEVTGLRFAMPELDSDCVIVDGLFGGDHTEPLTGGYQHMVRNINESGAVIISIDTPSGLASDAMSGLINRNIIHADLTLAVGLPHLSFFTAENAELVGRWKVIDIGLSREAVARAKTSHYLIERRDINRLLPARMFNSSKADYGDAIIFAGSYGMMGAAVLATKAAARSGCGKVTCHSPRCGYFIMQSSVPSALFESDSADTAIENIELRRNHSAVAIGPGIGTADHTIRALESFLKVAGANSRPVILDADALNCIALRPTILNYLPPLSVLTPHAGEFDRIFGPQPSSEARMLKAIEIARYYKIIIVLKGYYTATVRPDGKVFLNSSGTTALATAGTGDVLTGLIAGIMAQGFKPEIAAVAGVYIHGVAGRIAEQTNGTYGTTADDVADSIGRAIKSIMDNSNEKTKIQ